MRRFLERAYRHKVSMKKKKKTEQMRERGPNIWALHGHLPGLPRRATTDKIVSLFAVKREA